MILKLLFYLSLTFQAMAQSSVECVKFAPPLTGGYCVSRPSHSSNQDFVYHLHGSQGSEHLWEDDFYYTGQIQKFWQQNKISEPTVISISYGETWLLASKNSSPDSGLFEVTVNQIIPKIEASLGGLKGKRIVIGESMGAFNAIQLAFRTTLFKKAAILCGPMSVEANPFSSVDEIDKAIKGSGAYQYYIKTPEVIFERLSSAFALSREYFPTLNEWAAVDPFTLAAKANVRKLPSLYVASGFYDEFLSYEGNEKFVELLRGKGAKVEWRPQWGHHCAVDIPSVANFLSK